VPRPGRLARKLKRAGREQLCVMSRVGPAGASVQSSRLSQLHPQNRRLHRVETLAKAEFGMDVLRRPPVGLGDAGFE